MKNYPEIVELNKNSKLKYKLGETNLNIFKKNKEVFETINNFMSFDFYLPNRVERTRKICFYGFPTDEDKVCLASYYTQTPEDNVYGINVGMSITDAEEKLLLFGYKKAENCFVKGVIKIKFVCKEKFKDEQYDLLLIKDRHNVLNDEERFLLDEKKTSFNALKNKITGIEIELQSKYLGKRLY